MSQKGDKEQSHIDVDASDNEKKTPVPPVDPETDPEGTSSQDADRRYSRFVERAESSRTSIFKDWNAKGKGKGTTGYPDVNYPYKGKRKSKAYSAYMPDDPRRPRTQSRNTRQRTESGKGQPRSGYAIDDEDDTQPHGTVVVTCAQDFEPPPKPDSVAYTQWCCKYFLEEDMVTLSWMTKAFLCNALDTYPGPILDCLYKAKKIDRETRLRVCQESSQVIEKQKKTPEWTPEELKEKGTAAEGYL